MQNLRHNYREFDWKALLGQEARVIFDAPPGEGAKPEPAKIEAKEKKKEAETKAPEKKAEPFTEQQWADKGKSFKDNIKKLTDAYGKDKAKGAKEGAGITPVEKTVLDNFNKNFKDVKEGYDKEWTNLEATKREKYEAIAAKYFPQVDTLIGRINDHVAAAEKAEGKETPLAQETAALIDAKIDPNQLYTSIEDAVRHINKNLNTITKFGDHFLIYPKEQASQLTQINKKRAEAKQSDLAKDMTPEEKTKLNQVNENMEREQQGEKLAIIKKSGNYEKLAAALGKTLDIKNLEKNTLAKDVVTNMLATLSMEKLQAAVGDKGLNLTNEEESQMREVLFQSKTIINPNEKIEKDEPVVLGEIINKFAGKYKDLLLQSKPLMDLICLKCDVAKAEKGTDKDKKTEYTMVSGGKSLTNTADFEKAVKDSTKIVLTVINKDSIKKLEEGANNELQARQMGEQLMATLRNPDTITKLGSGFGLKEALQIILAIQRAFKANPPDLKGMKEMVEDLSAGRNPELIKDKNIKIYNDILAKGSGKDAKPNELAKMVVEPDGMEAKNLFSRKNALETIPRPAGLTDQEWSNEQSRQMVSLDHYMGETVPSTVKQAMSTKLGAEVSEVKKNPNTGVMELSIIKNGESIPMQLYLSGARWEAKFTYKEGGKDKTITADGTSWEDIKKKLDEIKPDATPAAVEKKEPEDPFKGNKYVETKVTGEKGKEVTTYKLQSVGPKDRIHDVLEPSKFTEATITVGNKPRQGFVAGKDIKVAVGKDPIDKKTDTFLITDGPNKGKRLQVFDGDQIKDFKLKPEEKKK